MRMLKKTLLVVIIASFLVFTVFYCILPDGERMHQGYGSEFAHEDTINRSCRCPLLPGITSAKQETEPEEVHKNLRLIHLNESTSPQGPTAHPITNEITFLEDLEHLTICNKSDPFILAVVFSAIPNTNERQLVRKTWANPKYYQYTKIRALFVLGATTNDTIQKGIEDEIELYQDIIQYNYIDAYRNLTYKTLSWMTWVDQRCLDVPWIAKIDDDVVVNPFHLNRYLVDTFKRNAAPNEIYGILRTNNKAMRNGKWLVTKEEYPPYKFPPFVLGPAYVIGRNAIGKLLDYAAFTPFLWLEDVFLTGLVAKAAGIKHVQAEKALYTRKLTRRFYREGRAGGSCFFIGANEKVKKNAWKYVTKYGPVPPKK